MKRHIPNLITCLNLAVGSIGIYVVFTVDKSYTFYFILGASVFDFMDGLAARTLNVRSEIGKQLDSLADLVSFGALPAFFLMKWISETSSFHWAAVVIVVFSALRLAKFNIDESQTDSFTGLPTPANAIMLSSLSLLPFNISAEILIAICVISATLLVINIKFIALKFKNLSWKHNQPRWILVFGSIVLIAIFKWTFVPMLIPFYIVISVVSFLFSHSEN